MILGKDDSGLKLVPLSRHKPDMALDPDPSRPSPTDRGLPNVVGRQNISQLQREMAQEINGSKTYLADAGEKGMSHTDERKRLIHTMQKMSSKISKFIGKRDREAEREHKKSKAAEEVRKRYMGGIAWGYDPRAGLKGEVCTLNDKTLLGRPHDFDLSVNGELRSERLHKTWGIEQGGPGKKGRHEHGNLRKDVQDDA